MHCLREALLFIILSLPLFCYSQIFDPGKLDSLFDRIEQEDQGMGSFAIFKGGQLIYARAFGYSSLEDSIKPTTSTKYRIGSISKTYTAAIILEMVNEAKLSLETPVSEFYPQLPQAKHITIEQLLRNRSGIHNFGNDQSEKYLEADPKTTEEVLKIFEEAKMDFKPGTKSDYNNANYVLLSLIAEEVDQMSFAEILQHRIVDALQLKNTYVGDTINLDKNEAYSYFGKKEWTQNPNGEAGFLLGAGAIVSTPSDLARFYYAVLDQPFFSIDLVEAMKTLKDGIGMGLYRYPFGNDHFYGHAGNYGAFSAMAGCFELKGVSFALCLNGERRPLNDILVEALRIYFGK